MGIHVLQFGELFLNVHIPINTSERKDNITIEK